MDPERILALALESHGSALRRLARVYAGSEGEEEDLYQEILLRVWRALPSFRGESSLGTWLYRVALNTALSYRRHAARRPVPDPDSSTDAVPAPVDTIAQEEAVLHEFLASVGPVDRAALVLRLDGLDNQQIAEVLGTTPGAVAVRLHRLRKRFEASYVER